jgi:hypothetical protein
MAEQSQSPKVYLVSTEQLDSLKSARDPAIKEVVSAIETQTIGSIPARLQEKAQGAKGTIGPQIKAALQAKLAELQAQQGSTESTSEA